MCDDDLRGPKNRWVYKGPYRLGQNGSPGSNSLTEAIRRSVLWDLFGGVTDSLLAV
jgi:hypothetical protein